MNSDNGPPAQDALPGAIWVCRACGKTSPNRYWHSKASYGWDESCMLNAVLCKDNEEVRRDASGRVTYAIPVRIEDRNDDE